MASELHRSTTTTTVIENDVSQNQHQNVSSQVLSVGKGIREISKLSSDILQDFQGAVKAILPLLSAEHQNQIYATFTGYHKMLMVSQKFLTRALILAARARTAGELMASIDIKTIQELCETVLELLEKFYKLNPVLEEKLRDERGLKLWRNIYGLAAGIGIIACSIAAGVGLVGSAGFTEDLKVFLIIATTISGAATAAAVVTHVAQHTSELGRMIMILKEIRNGLTQLSQNYPRIELMSQLLSDEDTTKQDFIKLLKDTEVEINKGFDILKQL